MSVWEEQAPKIIQNISSVSAVSWKHDGSQLICGGIFGPLLIFESGEVLLYIGSKFVLCQHQ